MEEKEIRKKLYSIYNHINYRCYNVNCAQYDRYGGRGIQNKLGSFEEFCHRVYDSFVSHLDQYGSYDTTIERIDNDKDYSYDNIRWATRKQQSVNRSTTVYFTIYNDLDNSKLLCNNMVDFCKRVGISWESLNERIKTGKKYENFQFELFDIDGIDSGSLQDMASKYYTVKIPILAYRVYGTHFKSGDTADVVVANLKEWCRNHCVDPSAAYKCVKGQRKTVAGFKVEKVIIYV